MGEYERWEKRYSATEYIFGEEPNAFVARHKGLLPKSGKALSVSDGEGRNGIWLAEQGLDVVSMDFSPKAQIKARALAEKRGVNITLELADIYAYDWPLESYDVIVVVFIQYMGPQCRSRTFAGIRQALKTGGLLLMEGYTPKQIEYGTGGPKEVENMYTRELLEQEFGSFATIYIEEYELEMHEGTSHGGMSAVIDLVARK